MIRISTIKNLEVVYSRNKPVAVYVPKNNKGTAEAFTTKTIDANVRRFLKKRGLDKNSIHKIGSVKIFGLFNRASKMKLNEKKDLIAALRVKHGSRITRVELLAYSKANKIVQPNWLLNDKRLRGQVRGTYNLIEAQRYVSNKSKAKSASAGEVKPEPVEEPVTTTVEPVVSPEIVEPIVVVDEPVTESIESAAA